MAERHRDLDRLLTFVDAVAAIAITLLVLPLAEVGSTIGDRTTVQLLREHFDDILGFVLSFVVIAQLWLAQHHIVGCLVRQNAAIIRLLMLWSFTIVVLPFPTSLITTTDHDPVAKIFYIGTMAASSLVLSAIAWVIGRHRDLRDTDEPPGVGLTAGITVAFLVALGISLAFPEASYWPLLILFAVDPLLRLRRRRR